MQKGQHMTEEMKENLRQKKLGKKLSPEHRLKVIKTLRHEKGEASPTWRGGRTISDEGYVLIHLPDHPMARSNSYYPEHRYVMEQKLGRILKREEIVHHINGVRMDNRLENLVLTTQTEHSKEHWSNPELLAWQSRRVKKLRKKRFWSSHKKK